MKSNTLIRTSAIDIHDLLEGPLKIVCWTVGRFTEMSELRVKIECKNVQ